MGALEIENPFHPIKQCLKFSGFQARVTGIDGFVPVSSIALKVWQKGFDTADQMIREMEGESTAGRGSSESDTSNPLWGTW